MNDHSMHDLPRSLETADGSLGWSVSGHQMSAMASCARFLDLPLPVVLRALETHRLAALIRTRKATANTPETRSRRTRVDALARRALIMSKRYPPW